MSEKLLNDLKGLSDDELALISKAISDEFGIDFDVRFNDNIEHDRIVVQTKENDENK